MVGNHVPEGDEHWENFVRILEITDYLFAPRITPDDVGFVQYLIEEHHTQFVVLYPNASVTPKMHYLVHMPRLMME